MTTGGGHPWSDGTPEPEVGPQTPSGVSGANNGSAWQVGDYVVIDAAQHGAWGSVYRIRGGLYDICTSHSVRTQDGQRTANVIEDITADRLTSQDDAVSGLASSGRQE